MEQREGLGRRQLKVGRERAAIFVGVAAVQFLRELTARPTLSVQGDQEVVGSHEPTS